MESLANRARLKKGNAEGAEIFLRALRASA
jgi:hypothetical protein